MHIFRPAVQHKTGKVNTKMPVEVSQKIKSGKKKL
jgi:hypothetical protein